MTRNNNTRQQIVASLKSAIATAAVIGTIGGWVTFGAQQSVVSVAAVPVAQIASTTNQAVTTTTNQDITTTASAAALASTTSVSQRRAITSTRSS
jgi:hypothetical protein